jgi:hypothetical protein
MPSSKRRNPFYIALIPAGLAFVVTAWLYGRMAFQVVNEVGVEAQRDAHHPLYYWLRNHGNATLLGELILLAVLTVGAMAFDSWTAETKSAGDLFESAGSEKRI